MHEFPLGINFFGGIRFFYFISGYRQGKVVLEGFILLQSQTLPLKY